MICISVTPESRQLAKVDLLNAARQCDLIELCLDHLIKEPDVKDLIAAAKKPVLISCRRAEDGGQWTGPEDERIALLKQAIISGPAYVELDEAAARQIPRFGQVKRVLAYTSLKRPLTDIETLFDQAKHCQADVIKFTWPTDTLEAAWPLLAGVSQKRDTPVVGLGLGRAGLTFSLLGRKYGSPWIYAALEKGMEAFPGQPTVTELDDVYRWRAINPKTRFVAIAGTGTSEAILAKVLNAGFDRLGLNSRSLPVDFKSPEQLGKMLDILKIPAVVATAGQGERLDKIVTVRDEVARASRQADLLLKQPDGWAGYPLLWQLAVRHLEITLGAKRPDDRPLDRRLVTVLGHDGLARSIALGLRKRGALVSLSSGDDEAARQAAQACDCRHLSVGQLYDTHADVLVVTTPNLDHGLKKAAVNPGILRPGMTLLDLSRLPADTPLVEEAAGRGVTVIPPAPLFAEHVSALFHSLTGHPLPLDAFAEGLLGS